MRASRKVVAVAGGLVLSILWPSSPTNAQAVLESSSFADPNLLAAIFTPSKSERRAAEVTAPAARDFVDVRHEFSLRPPKYRIPENWEAFERQYAPKTDHSKPTLNLMEKGMYEVNQTLYSLKLFEKQVNSLLSFEYTMRELGGYDPRSKQNKIDDFFDHAKVKTEFDWDAPIGLYVGVKLQIQCDSIFQFWK